MMKIDFIRLAIFSFVLCLNSAGLLFLLFIAKGSDLSISLGMNSFFMGFGLLCYTAFSYVLFLDNKDRKRKQVKNKKRRIK